MGGWGGGGCARMRQKMEGARVLHVNCRRVSI